MKISFTLLSLSLILGSISSAQADLESQPFEYFSKLSSPEQMWAPSEQVVVRGQTPTFDDGSGGTPYFNDGGTTFTDPNAPQYAQPVIPAQPIYPGQQVDPFLNPQAMMGPQQMMGPGPMGVQAFPGVNGPQPYRFGWTLRGEFEYLSDENFNFGASDISSVESFGLNVEAQNAEPLGPSGWVIVKTPNFMWRSLNGIPSPIDIDDLFQFGLDLKLVSPSVGGWGMELAFEPSINTDLNSSLDESFGLNLDGRGALLWQWGPQLTWIGGIMYLERVEDRILPYGGAVWRPNQLWEFRLMYPKSQAKVFMGNYGGWSHWLYGRVDFLHSEAYQIEPFSGYDTQIQVEDMRATIGWQFDNGVTAGFFEAGWIFDREIETGRPINLSGTIDDGFIARAGLRF